jgi:hypothetical protein
MDPEEQVPTVNGTLALVVVSWFAWTVFQTGQLMYDRKNLEQVKANQEAQYQQALRVKAEIDAIATDTLQLAAHGNANAQTVIDEMKRRGTALGSNPSSAAPQR